MLIFDMVLGKSHILMANVKNRFETMSCKCCHTDEKFYFLFLLISLSFFLPFFFPLSSTPTPNPAHQLSLILSLLLSFMPVFPCLNNQIYQNTQIFLVSEITNVHT